MFLKTCQANVGTSVACFLLARTWDYVFLLLSRECQLYLDLITLVSFFI